MKIELKKIKHMKSMSEETPCYSAEVWVDGKLICHVGNHGQGGCDEQRPIYKKTTNKDIERVNEWLKANHPPSTYIAGGKEHSMAVDLELYCHFALDEWEDRKRLKALLKRTVVFKLGKDVRSYKGKLEGVQRAHAITETLRKHPEAVILNNLPEDEALKLFKAA